MDAGWRAGEVQHHGQRPGGGGGARGGGTAGTEQRGGGSAEEGTSASMLMFFGGSGSQVKGQSMVLDVLCSILNGGKEKAISLTQME